jgi:hypothetical protein
MKQTSIILVLVSFMLVACSDKKKSSSSVNCALNPYQAGCMGYTNPYGTYPYPGMTTGGTTGNICTMQYPPPPGCYGTTTGGTTGTTTGGYTQIPSDNNWQSLYPSGVPTGTCSSPVGEGNALREGTVTLAGGMMYSPSNPWNTMGDTQYSSVNYSHNNSYYLTNVSDAKAFFETDARLKVRLKVRPQPAVSKSQGTWCLGRQTGMSADVYGYKSLKFAVSLRGLNADGSMQPNFVGTQYVSAGVNSCTNALDFSGLQQNFPNGAVIVIHDVQSDQSCWYGSNCTAFGAVRSASCWQMDFQVSVDGTKDIN